jgi:NAD(P)-dependent dehydrogenase (short-subunit alcohol dehydrogenase family)
VSKAGIIMLTRYLAAYWGDKKVRVNALVPGGVYNKHDPLFERDYRNKTPLGRMADKKDYNGAIIYLISDSSSYMTGACLVVDGGWTIW